MKRLLSLAPLVAAAAVFGPILSAGFVLNWDDGVVIVGNPHIRSLGAGALRWMFLSAGLTTYQPVTWLLYALLRRLWGPGPFGVHLASLALHAANAVLVGLVARRLLAGARGGKEEDAALPALGAALLFAVHPLQVEAVAWGTGLAELAALFFVLLSVLAYLERRLSWSFAFYVLAALSRWRALALPLGLLLLEAREPERRMTRRAKFAFAAVWALLLLVDARAKDVPLFFAPGGMSLVAAAKAALVLPAKLLWPAGLRPFYLVDASRGWILLPVAGGAAAAWRFGGGAFRAASLFYLAVLAPVLFYPWRPPIVLHDHYAYVSCAGFFLLAGGALDAALRAGPRARRVATALTAALLLVLAVRSRRRLAAWRDAPSLWRAALSERPGDPLIAAKLAEACRIEGVLALDREDLEGSLALLSEAERAVPGSAAYELGVVRAAAARAGYRAPK